MAGYDVAQICREGHVVTTTAVDYPDEREPFCSRCGAPTIMACEACAAPIRGDYRSSAFVGSLPYDRPSFCTSCGQPYPWTAGALAAAREMADMLDGLKPEEREALKGSLDDLVRDTSRTPVAVMRFKQLAAKTGKEGANALRDVLIGIVTEGVRKAIWGA